jgi:NAD(P)-dependent dehydrogenase (short-subunit alcohol dehydrogenase family)
MATPARVAIISGGTGALGSVVDSRFQNNGILTAIPFRPGGNDARKTQSPAGAVESSYRESTDLTKEEEVKRFVGNVVSRMGGVDILINIAGGYVGGEGIGVVSLQTLEGALSLNLRTAFLMCSAVLPLMRAAGRGRIISVAAKPALVPTALRGPYAIAKRAVITLTETIAEEVRGTGITANAIAPSIIDTAANRASMPGADFGRWVLPEEIAELMVFLCSDHARSISGNVVKIYGGV